jgi:hypothetical protein
MVPKGLAAVVLASIPLQQGVIGGELIKNITYGVVLISIVITSLLVFLIEKTRLSDLYSWILSPGLIKFRLKTIPRPKEIVAGTEDIIPNGTKLFGATGDAGQRLPDKKDKNS